MKVKSTSRRADKWLAFEQQALQLARMVKRYGRMPPGGEGTGPGKWDHSDLEYLSEMLVPAACALIRQHRRNNLQIAETP